MIKFWLKVNVRTGQKCQALFKMFSQESKGKMFKPLFVRPDPNHQKQTQTKDASLPTNFNSPHNHEKASFQGEEETSESIYIRRNINILKRHPEEYIFRNLFKLILEQKLWKEPFQSLFQELLQVSKENISSFKTLFIITDILVRLQKKEAPVSPQIYQSLLSRAMEIEKNFLSYREHQKSLATLIWFVQRYSPELLDGFISNIKEYLREHKNTFLVDQQAAIVFQIAAKTSITEDEIKLLEELVVNIEELSDITDLADLNYLVQSFIAIRKKEGLAVSNLLTSLKRACQKIIQRLEKRPVHEDTFNVLDLSDLIILKDDLSDIQEFKNLAGLLDSLKVPSSTTLLLEKDSIFNHSASLLKLFDKDYPSHRKDLIKQILEETSTDGLMRHYRQALPVLKTIVFRKKVLLHSTPMSKERLLVLRDMIQRETQGKTSDRVWRVILVSLNDALAASEDNNATIDVDGLIPIDHPLFKSDN